MVYRRCINGYINTLTIRNTRSARRNVAIASLLDNMLLARSKSLPAAMDRQPGQRSSTPRTTCHVRPDERYNRPAEHEAGLTGERYNYRPTCGASALASDPSIFARKPRDRYIIIITFFSTLGSMNPEG